MNGSSGSAEVEDKGGLINDKGVSLPAPTVEGGWMRLRRQDAQERRRRQKKDKVAIAMMTTARPPPMAEAAKAEACARDVEARIVGTTKGVWGAER